jgi:hypothetical protein
MSCLTIHRHQAWYEIPGEHEHPEVLRHRLDDVFEQRVPRGCGEVLDSWISVEDGSMWFIRALHASLFLDAGVNDEEALGRAWTLSISRAVARAIAEGPDGDNVRCFRSRAEFVAEFIVATLRGRAWDEWYFKGVYSLRHLEVPSQVGEALIREPEISEETLIALDRTGEIAAVIRVLAFRYVDELLEILAPEQAVATLAVQQSLPWRIEARAATPLRRTEAERRKELLKAIVTERRISPAADPVRLRLELELRTPPHRVSQSPAGAIPDHDRALRAESARGILVGELQTPFTSVFVLLPSLLETGYAGEHAGLRQAILRKLAGDPLSADEALDVVTGAGPQDESDIPRSLLRDMAANLRRNIPRGDIRLVAELRSAALPPDLDRVASAFAAAALERFARRLIGMKDSSLLHLRRNFLDGDGRVLVNGKHINVELPLTPLRMLLRMAGFHHQTYSVPWLPGQEIELLLPDD